MTRHRRASVLAGLLVALVLVPGCAMPEPDDAGDRAYEVSGTFTENATSEEMQHLDNYTRDQGGEMALMKSLPAQFRAWNLSEAACEDVRAFATERAYVAQVGPCETPSR